jgi:hypothetical protein
VKNSGVTGLTGAGSILDFDVVADVTSLEEFGGAVILGENDAIAIKVDTTAIVHITLVGAFE